MSFETHEKETMNDTTRLSKGPLFTITVRLTRYQVPLFQKEDDFLLQFTTKVIHDFHTHYLIITNINMHIIIMFS